MKIPQSVHVNNLRVKELCYRKSVRKAHVIVIVSVIDIATMNFHIYINILLNWHIGRLKIWNFKGMILKYFKGQHAKVLQPFYFCYIHGFYSDHL